jgi:hypothetical protein
MIYGLGGEYANGRGDDAPGTGTGNAVSAVPRRGRRSINRALRGDPMVDDRSSGASSSDAERDRVVRDIAGRLFTRGVDVRDDDSNDDVTAIEEAVERFESRVQAAGGDLMVDEPPRGQTGQPDDTRFKLPLRNAGEPASRYLERLARAADDLRSGPRNA